MEILPFTKHNIDASRNMKAFLLLIRKCEGTSGENGYRTHFGGSLFTSYADHPRKVITKSGYSSSAAGAYQFLTKTWDGCVKALGLKDFSPASQDKAAVYLITRRGALNDVESGNLKQALNKCSWEWASLPPSRYGQPNVSTEKCTTLFKQYGGTIK